jgi:hypothetical protein
MRASFLYHLLSNNDICNWGNMIEEGNILLYKNSPILITEKEIRMYFKKGQDCIYFEPIPITNRVLHIFNFPYLNFMNTIFNEVVVVKGMYGEFVDSSMKPFYSLQYREGTNYIKERVEYLHHLQIFFRVNLKIDFEPYSRIKKLKKIYH